MKEDKRINTPTSMRMRSSLYARKDPYQMMLVLGMVGSGLVFLFLMLAYSVRTQQADWLSFKLPRVFWLSSIAIVLSSVALHQAKIYIKQEAYSWYRRMLGTALALSVAFTLLQIVGGLEMYRGGITIQNNTSAAFIYLFSGLHLIHLLLGIAVLTITYFDSLKNSSYIDAFIQQLNPIKKARLELMVLYWHFVDALWLVLFLFLLYFHH